MICFASSISSGVVKRVNAKRTDLLASFAASPIAMRTWLGFCASSEQALPEETARWGANEATNAVEFKGLNVQLVICGNR